MKNEITQHQIDTYREQGFVAIEGFYSSDEIKRWKDAVEESVNKRLNAVEAGLSSGEVKPSLTSRIKSPVKAVLGKDGAQSLRKAARAVLGNKLVPEGFNGVLNTNQGDKDSYYAQVYIQCIRLAAENPVLKEIILDPRLGKVATTLAGVDGVRLYHDQALFKPALGNPTAWHLDNPYWSFFSRNAMTMWVAIEDATLSNGCMWYVPGSHKTAATDKNLPIGDNFAGLFKLYPEWKQISPASAACPAGSVVFHNGLTAHGAGVNMTNRPRRAFAVAFMPEGSTFNGIKDVLPDDYFKSLKVGDLLNNENVNPLIWHKDMEKKAGAKREPALAGV
jgi:hypothetical protein